ncbi:MAG: cyclase [Conexibacter sp.]|nr:cyclase [Conexibacter sp.]
MTDTVTLPAGPLRLVDLSQRLGNATRAFEPNPHEIEYIDHRTAATLTGAYGIEPELWVDGEAWAVERVTLSTHSGTHVDAPYHYASTTAGRPARTIDDVPLRWCLGPGVVLDFTHKQAGEGIEAGEVEHALELIGHDLQPLDIVLIRTDVSLQFETAGYDRRHSGLRLSATEWLVDHGVRLIGIDAWGLDRPLGVMADEARAGDRDQLWESHFLGRRKEYCQIEKLVNLSQLPPSGFLVSALPIRLADASAAWSRVVAMVPEGDA